MIYQLSSHLNFSVFSPYNGTMNRIIITLVPLLFSATLIAQENLYATAHAHYEKAQYTEALTMLDNIPGDEAIDFETWMLKGNCLQKEDKFKEATAAYSEAAKLNSQSALLYANWSAACYNLNQIEAAEKKAKKALKLDSELPEANYFMGNIKYHEFNLTGALRLYNTAIKSRPDYRDALYMRAATHGELRNYKSALRDYAHVLELDPALEVAKYNMGVIQLATESFAEASKTFSEINPDKLPKPADFYYYQAEALYFDGKKEEASALYQKAAELGDTESAEIYEKYYVKKEVRSDKPQTRTIRATF